VVSFVPANAKSLFPKLLEVKKEIDSDLTFPQAVDVKREVTKMVAPFNVVREMVIRNPELFLKNVEDREEFEKSAGELLDKLYAENRGNQLGLRPEVSFIYF